MEETQQAANRTASLDPASVRLAVFGTGKMGGTLLKAFLASGLVGKGQISGVEQSADHAQACATQFGVPVGTDPVEAAKQADVILLAVKPWQVVELIAKIAPVLTSAKMLVSVAAGIGTQAMEQAAGCELAVVRTMPNMPAAVGAGATALCAGRFVSLGQMGFAERLFATVGRTVLVTEKQIDAVTGLSGSGPAFCYLMIEALADAGVQVGLARDVATTLAAQTMLGAARMVLETGQHPAQLKDAVTTPGGTTIAGLIELERGGLRATLIAAVMRAAERSRELAG
jgi:pyrroline-5-carboxylate reductase